MPRKPREEVEGAIHHVYARGNNRQPIFVDDVDRRRYLALLAQVVARERWSCLTYCLMPNHVHLLIRTPEANLGRGMQRLQGQYARSFNTRHGRIGHLFQGRYGAVRIEDDAQLWMTVAYIVRNPVTAGLAGRIEDWEWSADRATRADGDHWLDSSCLLAYFEEGLGGDPQERYAECVGGGGGGGGGGGSGSRGGGGGGSGGGGGGGSGSGSGSASGDD